ncbi:hypothetical protein B0H14DRAFT_3146545 [Mycena olivaceomarginata]|nr:hypothetical protein B0H14DRAFT_3146545 [Mycena olivaceomarginata]
MREKMFRDKAGRGRGAERVWSRCYVQCDVALAMQAASWTVPALARAKSRRTRREGVNQDGDLVKEGRTNRRGLERERERGEEEQEQMKNSEACMRTSLWHARKTMSVREKCEEREKQEHNTALHSPHHKLGSRRKKIWRGIAARPSTSAFTQNGIGEEGKEMTGAGTDIACAGSVVQPSFNPGAGTANGLTGLLGGAAHRPEASDHLRHSACIVYLRKFQFSEPPFNRIYGLAAPMNCGPHLARVSQVLGHLYHRSNQVPSISSMPLFGVCRSVSVTPDLKSEAPDMLKEALIGRTDLLYEPAISLGQKEA